MATSSEDWYSVGCDHRRCRELAESPSVTLNLYTRLQLKIEKLVYGGDGLGRLPANESGPGKTVFTPFVLEGETAEITITEQKRSFARGRVKEIVQASPHRVQAVCPYFQRCGGCHYQHADDSHQLEIKVAILQETLRRTAKIELECELQIHSASPWHYRNRTRFKVRNAPQFAIGYYKFASHELLPIEQCPISSPFINRTLTALWATGREGKLVGVEEIEIFASAEDAELLLEVYVSAEVVCSAARKLAEDVASFMPEIAGVSVFRAGSPEASEFLANHGEPALTYRTSRASYRVSAGAFFQANRFLVDELTNIVVAEALPDSIALDLYAGVGLFSSVLARTFPQVIAVEPSHTSTGDLSYNSPQNVEAVRATTEQYLKNAVGKLRPDLVVVDPPRGGLGEGVVTALHEMSAPRITYVSCDPATLARDLAGFTKAGYRIAQAHLVDMFPQTFHIESVFQLVR